MNLMRYKVSEFLRNLPSFWKIFVTGFADFLALCVLVFVAYMLRVADFSMPPQQSLHLYFVAPIISVATLGFFGIYASSARGHSTRTEALMATSLAATVLIWAGYVSFWGGKDFSRSVLIIFPVLAVLALVALRRLASWFLSENSDRRAASDRKSVLIFGAGREGVSLTEALERQGWYKPVAFVDTDYTVVGRTVRGLKVHAMERLEYVIARYKPSEVLIAKRGQTRSFRRTLLSKFTELNLTVKIVPDLDEITNGSVNVNSVRPVKIEDLLGRDPVSPDAALMNKAVSDKNVLVTGAGGSIGSELCRQALAFGAKRLVLVENNEFALFEIHRELEIRDQSHHVELVPVLATILDGNRVRDLMTTHEIDIVFHAAAYKHVRMVQENALAGIENNIWGTKTVAEAALAAGVKRFVLVSTDKAVRPTSTMGATKRVAEMIIQALAAEHEKQTTFSIVRFGNVLGSTGSVVPLFREQIASGGPVLVTHPEVTRYFMLIPEAAQLVIQAGAMAEGGEVFVLDMGESIKIVQLAQSMIELAGLTLRDKENPDGDIEIKFIGLRDGEKMYEELQIGNDISTTSHQRIMRSDEVFIPLADLAKAIDPSGSKDKSDDEILNTVMKLASLNDTRSATGLLHRS